MNNVAIALPWALVLLPLPLLVWWLAPPYRVARGGLQVPFLERLSRAAGTEPGRGATIAHGTPWRWIVLWLCWGCVVLAVARPQYIEPPISKQIPVRDMLLAVDLSGSMSTKDFANETGETVDRLTAVKEVLHGFLDERQGDRVGLIFFGSAPFVQAPFTEDLEVVGQLLEEAQVKMAGPQTAFGDALGLAINVFDRSTVKDRVLIALTDGNDTNSQVPPEKAAGIAHDKGIVIHTVAVGDPKAAGEDALDEVTLRHVASATGGMYSHASDRKQLQDIYDQLNQIETRKVDSISHRPRRDVFWWPLGVALLLSLTFMLGGLARSRMASGRSMQRSAQPAAVAPLALVPALSAFHLLRPAWLLALIPAAFLLWRLKQLANEERGWRGVVAPHLLPLLWSGDAGRRRFGPLHWVGLCWLVAIIAMAGPTWRHQPSPFADDTAALALVINVDPSMETEDVQPSRLERATQKIHDLLKARGNAKSALIAYAGSAHVVMPPTTDAGIIDNFAGALSPDLMPVSGDDAAAALALADQALEQAGGGTIVWITDSVSPDQADALAHWRRASATHVQLWPPLLPGDELDAVVKNADSANPRLVKLAADDSDVSSLASEARFAPALSDSEASQWADSGYWLMPLLALMMLMFFRRGWMIPMRGARI